MIVRLTFVEMYEGPPPVNIDEELETILEGIGEGFYALDADWRVRRFNRAAERHFGLPAHTVLGRILWDLFPGARETGLGLLFWNTMANRQVVESETQSVVIADRWLSYRLFPLGDGLGVVFRDITDRKRAEAQRDLLLRELHHRLANTFATIQSIASQTFRKSHVDTSIREAFNERLLSLSRAHAALFNENWEGLDLHGIIIGSLTPYRSSDDTRVTIAGPAIRLGPQSAISLSMAIHELSTNAAKYGALSSDTGKLSVTWALGDRFSLTWKESGGPAVEVPKHKGFGTTMLQRVLADQLRGTVTVEFEHGGVVCSMDAPSAALTKSEA